MFFRRKKTQKKALQALSMLTAVGGFLIIGVAGLLIFQSNSVQRENNASLEYFDLVLKKERLVNHFQDLISSAITIAKAGLSEAQALKYDEAVQWVRRRNAILEIDFPDARAMQIRSEAQTIAEPGAVNFALMVKNKKIEWVRVRVANSISDDNEVVVDFSAETINELLESIYVSNLGQTLLYVKKDKVVIVGDFSQEHEVLKKQLIFDEVFAQVNSSQKNDVNGIITSDPVFPFTEDELIEPTKASIEFFGQPYVVSFEPMVLVSLLPKKILAESNRDYFKNVVIASFAVFLFLVFGACVYVLTRFRHEESQEDLRIERQRSLERSRLASIGETAAGIAHEINNPMTVIQMNADVIKMVADEEKIDTSQIKKSADNILSTVKRISSVVRGLQTLGRKAENDPLNEASLNQIIEDAVSIAKLKIDKSILSMKIKKLEKDYAVMCRPSQLSQVFINLIVNATHAVEDLDEKWIQIDCLEQSGMVSTTITDSGHGISEIEAEKIFNPFYTTKEVGKGTGLGLSLSKKIIEEHGGHLFVDRECKNTRFVIQLPMLEKEKIKTLEVRS